MSPTPVRHLSMSIIARPSWSRSCLTADEVGTSRASPAHLPHTFGGDVGNMVESSGVPEGPAAGNCIGLRAEQDLLHRDLESLSRERRRDTRNLVELVGDVAWREFGANRGSNDGLEVIVEDDADAAGDEQHERAWAVATRVLEVDDEAVGHSVDVVDDTVELGRAHPDTASVERGVGSTGDDAGAARGDRDPIAVAPHAWEPGEIRLVVARPVRAVSYTH